MAGGIKNRSKAIVSTASRGITRLYVRGYKSLADGGSIEIRPLTVLAGPNSSGKSSIVQPLLLMKQTVEASFDPGPLLLDGPNLSFTKADQFLSRLGNGKQAKSFVVGFETGAGLKLEAEFAHMEGNGFRINRYVYETIIANLTLTPDMSDSDIQEQFSAAGVSLEGEWTVTRVRCFLRVVPRASVGAPFEPLPYQLEGERDIADLVHVRALRGNPARTYPAAAVGLRFPGTFERYCASIVARWQADGATPLLKALASQLARLGLTAKITVAALNETEWELRVGRLPVGPGASAGDLVNIADVGFGVSQTLPVLLALLVARPGQLVFIEQPEVHLHPRAQTALAEILAEAARRGVRVVVETHSDLLLLGIQTLVAEGKLPARDVKLHWFQRSPNGVTQITSADLDEKGTFGNWPEDFADVRLDSQSRFLDAAECKAEKP